MRRAPGHANVEEHPKGSGLYRVRARVEGKLKTLASKLSKAAADEAASAYAVVRNTTVIREGVTLSQFGLGFMDRRERMGVRGIATDRTYWNKHVAASALGKLPVSSIRRRDCLDWLDALKLKAHRSRKKALSLLRVALQDAVDRELLEANPARDVRVHRAGDRTATDDLAGILTPPEQQALIAAVPEASRALVVFALMTGLRQAEQWWLQHEDLYEGHIVVRRSVGGLPPKSGRDRTVYLLGPAQRALELALSLAKPGVPWVWPGARKARRQQGKAPKKWRAWVRAAGITRRVRWKDLRHTCATALLAGWWGRKWSIDEVCQHLGHSSVKVTEIYARKLAETNQLAVAGTVFPASSPMMLSPIANPAKNKGADSGIRTRDLRFTNELRLLASPQAYTVPRSRSGTSFPAAAWALAMAARDVGVLRA
jgi:integrase